MTASELVRVVGRVGIYNVACLCDVPKAVEEAVTDHLLRHPFMVPPGNIVLAWNHWPAGADSAVFRTGAPEDEALDCLILNVSEKWWSLTTCQRERAFVEDMLIERLLERGTLRVVADDRLELLYQDEILSDGDAVSVMMGWVDEVLSGSC